MDIIMNDKEKGKRAAGRAAAAFIEDGMTVGLGTGSTAAYFIERLIERCREEKLKVVALATSERSYAQAKAGGICLYDVNQMNTLDITVDGADEIDHRKRMIKGGGGALLREKIVANMSHEMVVIVDSSKYVEQLGAFPLSIEILPFAYKATLHQLQSLGFNGTLRKNSSGIPYVTDNGNYIVDISLNYPCVNPEQENLKLQSIPGVLETGFFFEMAGRVVIGHSDGHVEIK